MAPTSCLHSAGEEPSLAQAKFQAGRIEEIPLDELREDRGGRKLEIPHLSEVGRMHRHPLSCDLEFDGKWTKLNNFADRHANGDGVAVRGGGLPVRQDIPGVSDAPTIGQKVGRKGLEVHRIRGAGPRSAEGCPILQKRTQDPFLREITHDGTHLLLAVPRPHRSRGREHPGGTHPKQPVPNEF